MTTGACPLAMTGRSLLRRSSRSVVCSSATRYSAQQAPLRERLQAPAMMTTIAASTNAAQCQPAQVGQMLQMSLYSAMQDNGVAPMMITIVWARSVLRRTAACMSCAIVMNNRSLSDGRRVYASACATDWHDPFRDGDTSDASVKHCCLKNCNMILREKNIACLAGNTRARCMTGTFHSTATTTYQLSNFSKSAVRQRAQWKMDRRSLSCAAGKTRRHAVDWHNPLQGGASSIAVR